MKRTKKIIATGVIASSLLLSSSITNASFGEQMANQASSMQNTMTNQAHTMENSAQKVYAGGSATFDEKSNGKELREGMHKEIKNIRDNRKEFVQTAKDDIKNNLKNFKDSYKTEMKDAFKSVSKDIKQELKATRDEFKNEAKSIIEKMKDKTTSFADKIKLKEELDKLREEKFNQMEAKLAGNPAALKALEIRKAVFEKNKELREAISQKRMDFRAQRSAIIEKYKEVIIKKYGDRIDKMSVLRLEKINKKIDNVFTKIQNNKRLSETHKNKLLSILEGLKETINEKLKISQDTSSDEVSSVLDNVLGQ